MNQTDQILRSIAMLSGIKGNIPKNHSVEQRWVSEYHSALAKAETAIGTSLSEFKVEEAAVKRIMVSSNYLTGAKDYSDELYCSSAILLQKIDALMGYLGLLLKPAEKKMGFHES
jgi:hypothetical protein